MLSPPFNPVLLDDSGVTVSSIGVSISPVSITSPTGVSTKPESGVSSWWTTSPTLLSLGLFSIALVWFWGLWASSITTSWTEFFCSNSNFSLFEVATATWFVAERFIDGLFVFIVILV